MKKIALAVVAVASMLASPPARAAEQPVDAFLRMYNSLYQGHHHRRQRGGVAGLDRRLATRTKRDARSATRRWRCSPAIAGSSRRRARFLSNRRNLPPIVSRQLDKILLAAAEGPGTIPEVTRARVAAESHQSSVMDGFTFHIDGKPVSANDIDETLQQSRDLPTRLKAWEASKEIGKPLKPGIVQLQKLRNQVAREMKHSGYFALEVADYDMTDAEMMKMLDGFIADTRPLYREAARLRAHEAGRALPPAGAEADPGALDRQPLGAGVGRRGRGRRRPRSAVQGQEAGVDRPDRREVLHVDGLSDAAEVVLGEIGSVCAAGRLQAAQERARDGAGTSISTRTCARS